MLASKYHDAEACMAVPELPGRAAGHPRRADARQLPDHQIAGMARQQVAVHLIEHRDLGAQLADQLSQRGGLPCVGLGQPQIIEPGIACGNVPTTGDVTRAGDAAYGQC
jgi:hypothetical protein